MVVKKAQTENEKEETLSKEEIKELITQTVTEVLEKKEKIEVTTTPESTSTQSPPSISSAESPGIEKEQTPSGFSLDEPKKSHTRLIIICIIVVILLTIGGGIVLLRPDGLGIWQKTSESSIALPTPTASPTPQVEVNIQAYAITVLNGSGVEGAAGKAEKELTDAGFAVSDVGNAERSDFTVTTVAARTRDSFWIF